MAQSSQDEARVNARILYWGAEGSGKTENLRVIHRKLRPDHRGSLIRVPTRIDPTVEYETLPIKLGNIGGVSTSIDMIAVPGGDDQAVTRKQLLDEVDGLVLVIDSRPERIEANQASLDELRRALSDYGRRLEEIPLVMQYNKRDLSDPYTLDALHRRLDVTGAAVFEAVATQTTGVLQTLSTVSKRVVRTLRDRNFDSGPVGLSSPVIDSSPDAEDVPHEDLDTPFARMETAILDEGLHPDADAIGELASKAENLFDERIPPVEIDTDADLDIDPFDSLDSLGFHSPHSPHSPLDTLDAIESDPSGFPSLGPEFSIASVGEATRSGARAVRIPLVVADKEGRTAQLVLTISLDALPTGDVD